MSCGEKNKAINPPNSHVHKRLQERTYKENVHFFRKRGKLAKMKFTVYKKLMARKGKCKSSPSITFHDDLRV